MRLQLFVLLTIICDEATLTGGRHKWPSTSGRHFNVAHCSVAFRARSIDHSHLYVISGAIVANYCPRGLKEQKPVWRCGSHTYTLHGRQSPWWGPAGLHTHTLCSIFIFNTITRTLCCIFVRTLTEIMHLQALTPPIRKKMPGLTKP